MNYGLIWWVIGLPLAGFLVQCMLGKSIIDNFGNKVGKWICGAKVRGFMDHVNKESEFSGRDVLAILGDFGIGNNMEKSAAIESANKRLEQLRVQHNAKKCSSNPS